jgi:hypothetical protein
MKKQKKTKTKRKPVVKLQPCNTYNITFKKNSLIDINIHDNKVDYKGSESKPKSKKWLIGILKWLLPMIFQIFFIFVPPYLIKSKNINKVEIEMIGEKRADILEAEMEGLTELFEMNLIGEEKYYKEFQTLSKEYNQIHFKDRMKQLDENEKELAKEESYKARLEKGYLLRLAKEGHKNKVFNKKESLIKELNNTHIKFLKRRRKEIIKELNFYSKFL